MNQTTIDMPDQKDDFRPPEGAAEKIVYNTLYKDLRVFGDRIATENARLGLRDFRRSVNPTGKAKFKIDDVFDFYIKKARKEAKNASK